VDYAVISQCGMPYIETPYQNVVIDFAFFVMLFKEFDNKVEQDSEIVINSVSKTNNSFNNHPYICIVCYYATVLMDG
jgi:hypothetical protein